MIQTTFTDRNVMAELMAKMLWEIGAVHFSADKPYKFSSGMMSPSISTAASCFPSRVFAPPSWILPQPPLCAKPALRSSIVSQVAKLRAFRLLPFCPNASVCR